MTHAEDQVGRGLRAECALLNATVRWPLGYSDAGGDADDHRMAQFVIIRMRHSLPRRPPTSTATAKITR